MWDLLCLGGFDFLRRVMVGGLMDLVVWGFLGEGEGGLRVCEGKGRISGSEGGEGGMYLSCYCCWEMDRLLRGLWRLCWRCLVVVLYYYVDVDDIF